MKSSWSPAVKRYWKPLVVALKCQIVPQCRRCNQQIEITDSLAALSQRPAKLTKPLTHILIETKNHHTGEKFLQHRLTEEQNAVGPPQDPRQVQGFLHQ